jgi:hypothetical protein
MRPAPGIVDLKGALMTSNDFTHDFNRADAGRGTAERRLDETFQWHRIRRMGRKA